MVEVVTTGNRDQAAGQTMAAFKILCVSCGVKIREKASEDSYGLCLKCFYADLAKRLRRQPRVIPGEFVSER